MGNTKDDMAPPEREDADAPHCEALDRTGFFGDQAAGAVIRARGTGRFLLLLRSDRVLERGTWGNCGGAHHADEDPEDAARREIAEETGWVGEVECVLPAFVLMPDAHGHGSGPRQRGEGLRLVQAGALVPHRGQAVLP